MTNTKRDRHRRLVIAWCALGLFAGIHAISDYNTLAGSMWTPKSGKEEKG